MEVKANILNNVNGSVGSISKLIYGSEQDVKLRPMGTKITAKEVTKYTTRKRVKSYGLAENKKEVSWVIYLPSSKIISSRIGMT